MEIERVLEIGRQLPDEQRIAFLEWVILTLQSEKESRKDKARENGKKWGRPKKEQTEEEKTETKLQTIHKDIDWEECLKIIKEENSGVIDWTKDEQINYSTLLVRKLKETKRVENEWFKRQDIVRTIIGTVKWDTYYWGRCANPKKLYFNLWTLIKRCEKIWSNNQVLHVI